MTSNATHRDPVCGMTVDPATAAGSHTHAGHTYYFCAASCLEKFRASPERYLSAAEPALVEAPAGATWTCPMHPEIIRDGPGACPICGMALEPMTVTLEEGPNPELIDMTRRFWTSVALTVPLLIVAMGDLIPGRPLERLMSMRTMGWLELALATPVCVWAAWPFFERGWASVVNRSLNMFTLIALGVSVSYVYSVVATLFPGLFPAGFRDAHGEVGVYFEVAAAIVTLILLGQVLELRARSQTGTAIRISFGPCPQDRAAASRRRRRGGRAARARPCSCP